MGSDLAFAINHLIGLHLELDFLVLLEPDDMFGSKYTHNLSTLPFEHM
jgi:hypothetical protein